MADNAVIAVGLMSGTGLGGRTRRPSDIRPIIHRL